MVLASLATLANFQKVLPTVKPAIAKQITFHAEAGLMAAMVLRPAPIYAKTNVAPQQAIALDIHIKAPFAS